MIPYELIRSSRKTLSLEITRDCRVLIRAPRRASKAQIEQFVSSHTDWITAHLETQRQHADSVFHSPEEIAALKEQARAVLPGLVDEWSRRMDVAPTGLKITTARTRYGSCNGKNSLCFSCFLMESPMPAIELVVVHELCHIWVKNHGAEFYALLSQYLPDYRERKLLLRQN